MSDITNIKEFAFLRGKDVFVAHVEYGDLDADNEVTLGNLPDNCIVTNAYILRRTATQASATLKLDIGSTQIVAAAAMDATGLLHYDADDTNVPLDTGTGQTVDITPSTTLTAGEFYIVVEYINLDVKTGKMLNYTEDN